MSTVPQFVPARPKPLRTLGFIAFLLGIAHALLAGDHWTNHQLTAASFAFAAGAILILFLIAYAIAGRARIRDWNRMGLWFLLLSLVVLPVLVHGLPAPGIYPR